MSASTSEPPGLHTAMRTLRIDVVTAEVFAALADARIPSVLLKGPSIARWIYDKPGRPYEDCDLLVRQSDLERAELTLRSLGFECRGLDSMPGDWPKHAAVYRRGSVFVDLHRTLLGVDADSDRLWDALAPHRESMRVGGADVDVLDPAGRALVLALHAAKDGGRDEKPLRDLERALDALELDVWRSASDIATEVGAGAAFAAGLRRVPAGRAVCERLDLTGHVTPEIALREEAAPPLSAGIDWLLRSPGSSSKARLVLRKLFPPRAFMRDWSSLARRGPAGLALAYSWRLVWVAWRVVPALGAVIRARWEADRSRVGPRSEALRLPMWTKVGLATRIWIAFVRTRLTERRLPLPEAARRLAKAGRARTRVDPRRLGRIVGRVLRVGPWRPRCLFSALVLYRLLREQGDDADLVIGLGADPRSKDAHAWVEVDGVDAGPPPGRGGRTALARYPLRPGG